jgi:hypothetical protein
VTNRLKWAIRIAAAAVAAAVSSASAATPTASELEVKAAMLYNFIKFVEWPASALNAPTAPFVIGINGSGAFASVLAHTVADRTVQGRQVAVRQVASPAEMHACHVVFFIGSDAARGAAGLEVLRKSAVLTVGESPGFARRGGIIGFVMVDNRTNFEINVEASARVGLKVSSKLLRLASVVKEAE